MRCDLRKVPRIVLVCMKLHNFILDTGCSDIPEAIVYEQPRDGTKALPSHERARVMAPDKAVFLNAMAGTRNITRKLHSATTRDCLREHLATHGYRRPGPVSRRVASDDANVDEQ